MFVNTVDSFFSGLISNKDFANLETFRNIAYWEYAGSDYSPPLFFGQLFNPIPIMWERADYAHHIRLANTTNFDIPAHLFLDF